MIIYIRCDSSMLELKCMYFQRAVPTRCPQRSAVRGHQHMADSVLVMQPQGEMRALYREKAVYVNQSHWFNCGPGTARPFLNIDHNIQHVLLGWFFKKKSVLTL